MKYEELINEIENKNVEVVELNLSKNIKGLYADNVIALNKNIKTDKEKSCIIAEEIGHYYTSSGNILDLSDAMNIKQEKRAKNWGYEKLVSFESLIKAFKAGTRNKYEIAEYLNITEDFLEKAINHYEEKYGTFYAFENYLIYFDPFGIMEMFNKR